MVSDRKTSDEGAAPRLQSQQPQAAAPQRVEAQVERFFTAKELTRLPGLPGEPLIDLSEAADAQGVLMLRLFIDERGKVVDSRVEVDEGLPSHVSQRLQRAFSGYGYIPGEVAGRPVKAQVTMQITVREGHANLNGSR